MNKDKISKILESLIVFKCIINEIKDEKFAAQVASFILQGYDFCFSELKKEYQYLPQESHSLFFNIINLFPKENTFYSIEEVQSIVYYYIEILEYLNNAHKMTKLYSNQGYME